MFNHFLNHLWLIFVPPNEASIVRAAAGWALYSNFIGLLLPAGMGVFQHLSNRWYYWIEIGPERCIKYSRRFGRHGTTRTKPHTLESYIYTVEMGAPTRARKKRVIFLRKLKIAQKWWMWWKRMLRMVQQ
ncbi:hypothetical protein C5167_040954 [Papaver somniferum]|uniref:Uncharacterized protein n=1 Tax=Papaver somniferum TaxID=3469 RepID=A0A4Y7IGG4_PAPSO|nr:hypothetical protein C5167_040954 [Papaver somniferum]